MLTSLIDRILFRIRFRLYPRIHAFSCDGEMVVSIPVADHLAIDNECFMACESCGKRHHLAFITGDDENDENGGGADHGAVGGGGADETS
jgi:hypothetical protein